MLKDLATRLAATLGYAVLPKWRLAQLPMAERLRKIFAAHSIDTVIDVGANKGQYRDFLRHHVGYRGSIVSFEPLPEFAAKFSRPGRQRMETGRCMHVHWARQQASCR